MSGIGHFALNFADPELPLSSAVVTLAVLAASVAWYFLRGLAGAEASEQERRHWDGERGRRRVLVQDCVRNVAAGRVNPERILEALYDEAEGALVTDPPFGLTEEIPGVPRSWFPDLVRALGEELASRLQAGGRALEEAERHVQRCLGAEGAGGPKTWDARKRRGLCLGELDATVRTAERSIRVLHVVRASAALPDVLPPAVKTAKGFFTREERIRKGLTWEIGRLVVDARIGGWLALGACLKVLMGAPAPLQVLALSDAARGMERGGDEGYAEFATAIRNCFLFFCVEKLLQFLARITMVHGESLLTQKLQRKVYGTLLQQDYEFFCGKQPAVLQNLVHDSTVRVCTSLIFVRVRLLQAAATVFFQVAFIAWRFPSLALVVNLSLPVASALRYQSRGYIERAGARLKARGNVVTQRTLDVLSNLPTVRSHNRELGAVEDYVRDMAYQTRVNTKLLVLGAVTQPLFHFCDMICVYVGYYYGGTLIRLGSLTTAELMTVINQFQKTAMELATMLETIMDGMQATEHGRDVLDLLRSRPKIEPEIRSHDDAGQKPNGAAENGHLRLTELQSTEVEFREVAFAYPGAPSDPSQQRDAFVLKGLSFIARDGEFTALVGKSGCGKTTATLLVQRLFDVSQGSVLVGGRDVREQDVRQLRRSIAVVSQEPVLFGTSIRENLLYATRDGCRGRGASRDLGPAEQEERMVEACKRANAWGFVRACADGLSTDVGPRGTQLSVGQKQRLTIARAILKDAPLLILDEATSSLDMEAERDVQEALDQLMHADDRGAERRRVTKLVIAHRLSTVRRADWIVGIEGGMVREQGTHEELMAREGGIYARFLRLSLGEGARVPDEVREAEAVVPSRNGCVSPHSAKEVPGDACACQRPAAERGPAGDPAALWELYTGLRERWEALRAELGHSGGAVGALAEEVEHYQSRIGALLQAPLEGG